MSFNKGGDGQPRGFGFGGFSVPQKKSGSESQTSQMGYSINYHVYYYHVKSLCMLGA